MKTFTLPTMARWRLSVQPLIALAILWPAASPAARALSLTVLYSFTGPDGDDPASPLIQARDGNLYGTSKYGGPAYSAAGGPGYGLIYQVNPVAAPGTVPATVFAFPNIAGNDPNPDGANPVAPVIQGLPGDDNLYGTALSGGLDNDGAVFSVATSGTNFSLLQSFNGDLDQDPFGGLVETSGGLLFGTTAGNTFLNSDTSFYGTVFSLPTVGGTFTSTPFDDATDGAEPAAGLILGQDGNLYGTTWFGNGTLGDGVIFSLNPAVSPPAPALFYQLGQTATDPDGANPADSVFQDPSAPFDFTVTTSYGSGRLAFGTVDRISTTGTLIWASSFNGTNGFEPLGSVILASDGNYYGTTEFGGTNAEGNIFQVTPVGVITDIYDLNDSGSGMDPLAGLLLATDGYLYGTASIGGSDNLGTVFRLSLDPNLTAIAPSQATAGNTGLTITATGSNFNKDSVVTWHIPGTNAFSLATTYSSPTVLTAVVPAALLAAPGTAQVAVMNADGGTSGSLTFTINPAPVLRSLVPASHTAGAAAFTLQVNGTNFLSGDTVDWNGAALVTQFVSATELTASVPAIDIAGAGSANVTAVTPDDIASNSLPFTINPAPIISSIVPASRTAGAAAFTLQVNGTNFLSGDTVDWNGAALVTQFVSATQLTATVPAGDIATVGTANVTAVTPDAVASNGLPFTINPAPILTTLVPNAQIAGSPAFTLQVNGSNFVNGDTVEWNGVGLVTTFGSATQLSAGVPAADIATPGAATVTVLTVDNVASNGLTFTILPTPTITSLTPSSATAGDPAFTLTVNGTNFFVGDTVTWSGTNLAGVVVVNSGQITVPIPAANVATAGSAIITVVDAAGTASNGAAFTINPLHIFPAGLQIISVPYDYSGDPLSAVLSLPNTTLAVWNPATSAYILTPTAPADTLYQGHGAWVRFPQPAALISKGIDLTASTGTLSVSLIAGWNLIGDPYTVPVPLSSLIVVDGKGNSYSLTQADKNSLVYDTLYSYDMPSNSYQAHSTDTLQPYTGYWIDSFASCTLQIPSPNGNNPHAGSTNNQSK